MSRSVMPEEELAARKATYRGFVRLSVVFVAHVAVILAIMAWALL